MAYQISGGVIINDSRALIGVNTAGITDALYVGENITIDATAGSVVATEFIGDGSSLTGIVTAGGDADITGDLNLSGIATVGSLDVKGTSSFEGNLDLENNDILNGGAGNFASLSVSGNSTLTGNVELDAQLSFVGGDADEFVTGITTDLGESAGANELVTAEGAKSYVDSQVSAANQLLFTGNTGETGDIDLVTETLAVTGADNEIVTDVPDAAGESLTISLSSTLQLPGSLAFGAGQAITAVGVNTDLGDASPLDTTIPTQKAVKEYVDAVEQQVTANANLTLQADGSQFGVVGLASEALNLAGTASQIEVSGADETYTLALADSLVINGAADTNGGLQVTGITTVQSAEQFSPALTEVVLDVKQSAQVLGDITLGGELDLAAGLPGAGGIRFKTNGGDSLVQFVGLNTGLNEGGTGASDSVIPTEKAVKEYVDGSIGAANQLNFSDGTTTGEIDLASETLLFIGGTNVNVEVDAADGNELTINLDDDVTLSGNLDAASANITGIVTANDFNSTSDIRKKDNIAEIEGAVEKVQALRGVTFDWKDGSGSSAGVIAQEVEAVLPSLVKENEDHKTVVYNGLIGLLVQAVKEQQAQIDELRAKLG